MDITNMDKTTNTTNTTNTSNTDNTSNTKITNAKHCSLCGGIGHNKRSCPTKEIDDTSVRTQANAVDNAEDNGENNSSDCDSDYEEISISEKKMNLIKDLKIAQDYSIKGDVFVYWLQKNKSCSLKEVKICMDDGLNPEYTKLFIDCTKDFDEYY